jgi:hypothetical protein
VGDAPGDVAPIGIGGERLGEAREPGVEARRADQLDDRA